MASVSLSRRQQIINELVSIFQKNTKLYGHKTNIGSNVSEWKVSNFQESDLPALNIKDPSEEVTVVGKNHRYKLTIEIEARVSISTTIQTAREIIADIMVIMGENCTINGLVFNITPVSNELLDFGRADKKFGAISLQFEADYQTAAFKPYT